MPDKGAEAVAAADAGEGLSGMVVMRKPAHARRGVADGSSDTSEAPSKDKPLSRVAVAVESIKVRSCEP